MAETKTTQPKSTTRGTATRRSTTSRGSATNRSSAANRNRSTAASRSTASRRSPATGSTRQSNAATRRKAGAAKRSTTGKKAAETRAERAAATNARRIGDSVQNRVERVQSLAERAVLIQVGAALEARDRVVETVGEVANVSTSRKAAERQLKKFERRGGTARTRVERELRQRRSRIERTLGRGESRVERETQSARKEGQSVRNTVAANVDLATAQVENVVQTGVTAGAKLVAEATERVASTVS